jgi:hypothetical protein
MGADLLRRAEELVDIALTVSNVNAARRIAQSCTGLLEVFQPADALLLLDRNPRQVDSLLERRCSLEFFAGPEFDRGQSEWKTFAGHCKTGNVLSAAWIAFWLLNCRRSRVLDPIDPALIVGLICSAADRVGNRRRPRMGMTQIPPILNRKESEMAESKRCGNGVPGRGPHSGSSREPSFPRLAHLLKPRVFQ